MTVTIRPAEVCDASFMLSCIQGLATCEGLEHEVSATEWSIIQQFFCEQPKVFCLIAECDGIAAGSAIYFYNYSTFKGKHGMYLEDLYVMPEYRGNGIGKALMSHLAEKALLEGCCKVEWCVLRKNQQAIAMYESLGAESLDAWTMYQVSGQPMMQLAGVSELERLQQPFLFVLQTPSSVSLIHQNTGQMEPVGS